MSYTVTIWENPAGELWPTNIEESVKLLTRLGRLSPGQNPKFITLAKRLTQHFPTPNMLAETEAGEDDEEIALENLA